jgi:hypothetical protein
MMKKMINKIMIKMPIMNKRRRVVPIPINQRINKKMIDMKINRNKSLSLRLRHLHTQMTRFIIDFPRIFSYRTLRNNWI